MSKPLILRPKDCQGKQWREPTDLSHLQATPLLPLHAGELAKAATSMPLALIKASKQWRLVGVCGLNSERNLLIQDGQWQGSYFPVSLSSYPFELVAVGSVGFVTFECESGLLVGEGGQPFFDEEGQFSEAVAKRVELLKGLQPRQVATQKAIDALVRADVLMPWPDVLCNQLGMVIEGLHMVDERALAALNDEAFLSLRKVHALAVAYALNISIFQGLLLRNKAGQAGLAETHTRPGAIQSTGDLDLEFLNDSDTIKFGPLH